MMSPDNTNNNNQIEVFKPGEPLLERRRAPHASARIVEIEKAPDLLAYWKVIRKRRWTVLTAFTLLFAIVLVETLKQKPVYRAKALLEIDKENPSLVTPQELFQLDEVTDTDKRSLYAEMIAGLRQEYPTCRGVVTSRIIGSKRVRPVLEGAGLSTYTLRDFDWEQVVQFLDQWYAAVFASSPEVGQRRLERHRTVALGQREVRRDEQALPLHEQPVPALGGRLAAALGRRERRAQDVAVERQVHGERRRHVHHG